jgi:hypothetical protein
VGGVLCNAYAMKLEKEKPAVDIKKYTVGMKIPNDTYAGQAINPVHMTVTYLGEADESKLARAKKLLSELNQLRPIKVKIEDVDTFGTKERPVPVRRISIVDPAVQEKLIAIHKEVGEAEPFQPKKLDIPAWHVSVKEPKLQEEFAAKKNAILQGGKLFIKPLGNFDPILELE